MKLNINYINILLIKNNITVKEICKKSGFKKCVIYRALLPQTTKVGFLVIVAIMRILNITDFEDLVIDNDE